MSARSDVRAVLDCIDKLFQTKDRLNVLSGSNGFHNDAFQGFNKAIENQASALGRMAEELDPIGGDEEIIGFINRAMDMMETANKAGIDTEGINTAILAMLECFSA